MSLLQDIVSRGAGTPAERVQAGIVKQIVEESPVSSMLYYESTGNSVLTNAYIEADLPEAALRAYNSTGAITTYGGDKPSPIQLQDLHVRQVLDRVLKDQQVRGESSGLEAEMLRRRKAIARAIGLDFKKYLVGRRGVSATDPTETTAPKGLAEWVLEHNDTSTNPIDFSMGANGAELSDTGALRTFIQAMAELRHLINPTFYLCDYRLIATLQSLVVSTSTNDYIAASYFDFTGTMDVLGKTIPIVRFLGIPVIPAGENSQGEAILSYQETQGNATACTSVYAVRSDADHFMTYHFYPSLVNYAEYETAAGTEMVAHAPIAFAARYKRSVGRIKGIKAEA